MTNPVRINLYGGPGIGKSTLAAALFSHLKASHYKVELVTEYIKTWAWQGKKAKDFDQLFVFTKQMKRELDLLRAGVSVITDSPLLLNLAYVKMYNEFLYEPLMRVVREFNKRWPAQEIMLSRCVPYEQAGRYESAIQAQEMDAYIHTVLLSEQRVIYTIDPIADRPQLFASLDHLFTQHQETLTHGELPGLDAAGLLTRLPQPRPFNSEWSTYR